jgi:hypothetical protein
MKNLIEEVLNDPLFTDQLDKVSSESEKDLVKENVKIMLSDISDFYTMLMDFVKTEDGINEMSESIEYLISDEGIKEWQEKN